MSIARSPAQVLCLQVLALAALILPQLLTQFGFSTSLAASLLVIENALSALLEPLIFGLSDKSQHL
ncbi:hypothetical protein IQ244_10260 [Nostoc sp. LEGE 06077]|uniref:hypothetical protein n=1 Tax=Nostoc sp. LEGE 06077 TaxID=915325 RepID=UPI00187EB566|nr:hypothetical protein [Nostoc sp. LEGE 06077]MBE9206893.1 hypothetical protein [Nostoc sp. LEGE 06077]